MTEQISVLACQIDIPAMTTADERDVHVRATADLIRAALAQGPADLVVLPELSSIDYGRDAFCCLDVLAEALDGPTCRTFGAVAREFNATLVFGMPRRDGDLNFISQVVIGPDGSVAGHFDKLHRAEFGFSEEKEFFTPGRHMLTFDCCGVRIAPIICYDIRFPELMRTLVLEHGADLILHCGAYGRDESFDTWHAFVTTRAVENQVPVLSLNRAGKLFGDSIFCGPWVDVQHPPVRFPAHDAALLNLTVDTAQTRRVREKYTFLKDRFSNYRALEHVHATAV